MPICRLNDVSLQINKSTLKIHFMQNATNINRIKAVLAERNKTSKWLVNELNKDQGTISKWCTNKFQPSLETLVKIAKCLNVDVRDLIVKTEIE